MTDFTGLAPHPRAVSKWPILNRVKDKRKVKLLLKEEAHCFEEGQKVLF